MVVFGGVCFVLFCWGGVQAVTAKSLAGGKKREEEG